MNDGWRVSVLIPARNEEELLPRCLRSVLVARDHLPVGVWCDVVVAADSSTDQTYEVARRILAASGCGTVLESNAGMVGRARARAADVALMGHSGRYDRWWLANTDADCEVPTQWLTAQLRLAANGAQAVAGTIDVDCFREHDIHVEQRFRSTYLVRHDGTHSHVHGANLGVRADTYLLAGGWGDLETAEDHDLWNRLSRLGCKRVSTDSVRVLTSGRRIGRAPRGFAEALAAHNESAA